MPVPGDVSAAFRTLAEAFNLMRQDGGGGGAEGWAGAGNETAGGGEEGETGELGGDSDLLSQMIQILLRDADIPPREVEGASEEFCDGIISSPPFTLPNPHKSSLKQPIRPHN